MIYAHPHEKQAISELQIAVKKAENAKWYRRLKIIQLSMTQMSVPQLAKQFDICQATARAYIKAYNDAGIEGLKPDKSPGRPGKIAQLTRGDWEEILSRTPNQYQKLGTDSRQWTLERLAKYSEEYLGEPVHFDTVSKALKRCKYRTGRSKLRVGSPDPHYQSKRETAENLRDLLSRGN